MFRHVVTAAVTLLITSSIAGPASASAVCEQLRFDLANTRDTVGGQSDARKFARAIAEQKASLRKLNFVMRQNGCSAGSMVMIDSEPDAECGELETKQARMERNLDILEQKRIALLSDSQRGVTRQQIVQELDENGCNDEPMFTSAPDDGFGTQALVRDDPNGFETIRVPSSDAGYGESQFVDLGGAAANGNFRTMCVRTCDGAYFPVSSNASSLNFRRDAQVCSMMCPGTETELFYHSISQESAEMRSTTTGRSYDELPNANLFRTESVDNKGQCGCNFSLYYKEMMKREAYVKNPARQPVNQSAITWIKPELRGGLKPAREMAEVKLKQAERAYQPSDKIRIIGPRFLPDDGGLDFKTPTGSLEPGVN
jgi:hypothetical protein